MHMVSLKLNEFLEGVKKYRNEERGFIYDWCREKVEKAKGSGSNWYARPDAVHAILLIEFGWNPAAPETKKLNYAAVEELLKGSADYLMLLEAEDLHDIDLAQYEMEIGTLYKGFKPVFGQNGAAKALSVLNPELFMMWDKGIRTMTKAAYCVDVFDGEESEHYLNFLEFSQKALQSLTADLDVVDLEVAVRENIRPRTFHSLAKSLDEYLYTVTKF